MAETNLLSEQKLLAAGFVESRTSTLFGKSFDRTRATEMHTDQSILPALEQWSLSILKGKVTHTIGKRHIFVQNSSSHGHVGNLEQARLDLANGETPGVLLSWQVYYSGLPARPDIPVELATYLYAISSIPKQDGSSNAVCRHTLIYAHHTPHPISNFTIGNENVHIDRYPDDAWRFSQIPDEPAQSRLIGDSQQHSYFVELPDKLFVPDAFRKSIGIGRLEHPTHGVHLQQV